ncbi:hypothetical protein Rhopal_000521-T1 [Rhodotorula paludigena]|uniref:Uncharacterized protein n=1 Tax=Rhodotorula paludigena TaxID=86838 RepID=A0AAV5GE01_9BASI|nr:hypothetical protein Rhopal_000521-T1 [Rhodotorula paludigena]
MLMQTALKVNDKEIISGRPDDVSMLQKLDTTGSWVPQVPFGTLLALVEQVQCLTRHSNWPTVLPLRAARRRWLNALSHDPSARAYSFAAFLLDALDSLVRLPDTGASRGYSADAQSALADWVQQRCPAALELWTLYSERALASPAPEIPPPGARDRRRKLLRLSVQKVELREWVSEGALRELRKRFEAREHGKGDPEEVLWRKGRVEVLLSTPTLVDALQYASEVASRSSVRSQAVTILTPVAEEDADSHTDSEVGSPLTASSQRWSFGQTSQQSTPRSSLALTPEARDGSDGLHRKPSVLGRLHRQVSTRLHKDRPS